MEDVEIALSHELTRIIATWSRYPVSLAKLADILSAADGLVVQKCMNDRPPCTITKLGKIILTELPERAYTLRILQGLCHSSEFRDRLLLQNSGLLDALLTKACSSVGDCEECSKLCVLLLSRPLPATVPLSAKAQSFFLQVLERAIKSPCVGTLKPVHYMLDGACRDILSILPSGNICALDNELRKILTSQHPPENSMLTLWCFGIVFLIEHPQDTGGAGNNLSNFTLQTPKVTAKKQWKTSSGEKVFGSISDMHKAILLNYLNVVSASKGHAVVSDAEAIEVIRIATKIVQCMDVEVRRNWPTSGNLAEHVFPKLPKYILQKNIHLVVQFEALCFFATIVGHDQLPGALVAQYETTLLTVLNSRLDPKLIRETLAASLPIFAPHLQESTIRAFVRELLNTNTRSTSSSELLSFTVLAEELTVTTAICEPLSSGVVRALSSKQLQRSAQIFLRMSSHGQSRNHEGDSCHMFNEALRQSLLSATVSMFLTAAFTSRAEELAITLSRKQQELNRAPAQCSHLMSNGQSHFSLSIFEQKCTPSTTSSQQDWRDRLRAELDRQNFYQYELVTRSVSQICQELEARCEYVEEPLRRERDKVKELQAKVSEWEAETSKLQTKKTELEAEKAQTESELERVETERENISMALKGLNDELAAVNKRADETLRTVHEEFSAKELQLKSLIIKYEEDLRGKSKNIDVLNWEIKRLEDDARKAESERKHLGELHDALKVRSKTLEAQLESERQRGSQQTDEIIQLKGDGSKLAGRLNSTEAQLQSTTDQLEELQARHHESVQSSEEVLQNLELKYETDLEAAATKATEECDALKVKLQSALDAGKQSNDAYEASCRELQCKQNTITLLEAKVERLTDMCSEKDEQLQELQSWMSRQPTFMTKRNPSANPLPINTTSHSPNRSSSTTRHQHRRRKSSLQTQDKAPMSTQTAMENLANASFNSSDSSKSGPTPKRAKPRKPSFKVSAMHTSYDQKAKPSSKPLPKMPLTTAKRHALKEVSPNRRHMTVGFEEEDMSKDQTMKWRDNLQSVGQGNFDTDSFFAGTPFTPGKVLCGTGKEGGEGGKEGEETTVEL
ncbi:hypothetical protein K469DRAFT_646104 [Zopfia rhizophila CBS 207.26]|uniref:Uncharacterized protein n=1 Tax=Zopfia rhizophila CBS 207.26 TaxID=1314779 RepID=A0A6A6DD92_9PEZI|nr:hypothetical protein K469DRAFT_646104 [Zopfia rhizophila CBS 207.26]